MITTIDLTRVQQPKPLLSDTLIQKMQEVISKGMKVYLYLNHKGASHCVVCDTCRYIPRCNQCDHILREHRHPKPHLKCHLCGFSSPMLLKCPKKSCEGRMQGFGDRIQSVAANLEELFPEKKVVRIESPKNPKDIIGMKEADIIIGTQVSMYLDLTDVGLVGILLVESELAATGYNIEEKMYHAINYMSRFAPDVYLQTYCLDLPMLQDLTNGNFKSFFTRTLQERKQFGYPPFQDLIYIHIEKKTQKQVQSFLESFVAKLDYLLTNKKNAKYHVEGGYQKAQVYHQSIQLRGKEVNEVLEQLSTDIIKNSGVWVEYC